MLGYTFTFSHIPIPSFSLGFYNTPRLDVESEVRSVWEVEKVADRGDGSLV